MSRRSPGRKIIHCSREGCNNHTTANKAVGWNVKTEGGRIVAIICPVCQTPEEAEEAMRRVVGIDPTWTDGETTTTADLTPETISDEAITYAMQRALHRAQGKE